MCVNPKKNNNDGKIKLSGGKLEAKATSSLAYGIENGINGKIEITGDLTSGTIIDILIPV